MPPVKKPKRGKSPKMAAKSGVTKKDDAVVSGQV